MLEGMRQFARLCIAANFLAGLAWYLVIAGGALVGLFLVVVNGEYDEVPGLLGVFLTIAAFLGFVGWVARDARRTARSLRQQRLQAGTREDGEGTSPDGDHD